MEPEKTPIDAILDAYDHRLVEARQREAEQESKEVDFVRRFVHFRDEVAEPILTSVGLQLASRGHGSEIRQEDVVHTVDGRQETLPAIAIRLFPGSLHAVPGVEQYPSLTLLGNRRAQKVVTVADAQLRLPGEEDERDGQDDQGRQGGQDGDRPQGRDKAQEKNQNQNQSQNQDQDGQGGQEKDSPPDDRQGQDQDQNRQDQGQDQQKAQDLQQGQKPQQQQQEPAEETMELFELTPRRLRDLLTQLVADAFGRLPRDPRQPRQA